MYPPDVYDSFFRPRTQPFIDLDLKFGCQPLPPCCGAPRSLMPKWLEMGHDVVMAQPEPPGMDPEGLKRDFGNDLTFVGLASVQKTLGNRLQKIAVEEPNLEDTVKILEGLRRRYESHHDIEYSDSALEAAARPEALSPIPPASLDGLDVSVKVVRGKSIMTHVLTAAVTDGADLIVVGKQHAPNFGGLAVLGGTTGRVLRGANCSVLTVPA